ncbi:MAG: putative molybdenum transporter permease protein [Phycisphaerales bacterium]|nr:putative molybdenum transporter permease protein [Phycisphaerales bacterium]
MSGAEAGDVWSALLLSVRIAAAATAVTAVVGVPLAYALARRRFVGRSLLEGFVLMPMVLPPTVVGYAILTVFGARGWLAPWLGGYSVVFRFEGAVLAATVVALPMLYLPAKAGFASVEREVEDVARLLGAGRWYLFRRVSVPLARRGLASGVVLAFARALGEFGATVMVFGLQPGRVTLPISVYADYEQGDLAHATAAVAVLSAASLAMILLFNATAAGRQE